MGRKKAFGDDDMSNYAFDQHDEADSKSDDELLDEWSTEGPEDKEAAPKKKGADGEDEEIDEPKDEDDEDDDKDEDEDELDDLADDDDDSDDDEEL